MRGDPAPFRARFLDHLVTLPIGKSYELANPSHFRQDFYLLIEIRITDRRQVRLELFRKNLLCLVP